MRPALFGYFDLGQSYGLADSIFESERLAPELDISLVGWTNPLGRGVAIDLLRDRPDTVQLWRSVAETQPTRPDFETGWSDNLGIAESTFDLAIKQSVSTHQIEMCELRIYAVGTVFIRFQLAAGLPEDQVEAVLKCFEYAAYTPAISLALYRASRSEAGKALASQGNALAKLSQRKPPQTLRDSRGYEESDLITAFTNVLLCVDSDDSSKVGDRVQRWQLDEKEVIAYEYHGRLHYSWSTCLLEPRYRTVDATSGQQHSETALEQIERMLACIQLAHVFLGACEAMTDLFIGEMKDQAGTYVAQSVHGRTAEDLNRLRTLALAVVSLTSFNLVTPTEEDQQYFAKFEEDAHISRHHDLVSSACDVLYNVQTATQQAVDAMRGFVLNAVVLVLTALSLISVLVGSYDFIRSNENLLDSMGVRIELLAAAVLILTIVVVLLVIRNQPGRP